MHMNNKNCTSKRLNRSSEAKKRGGGKECINDSEEENFRLERHEIGHYAQHCL